MRSDGTSFGIGESGSTPPEQAFVEQLVEGQSYQLPEDFIALLRKAGATNASVQGAPASKAIQPVPHKIDE